MPPHRLGLGVIQTSRSTMAKPGNSGSAHWWESIGISIRGQEKEGLTDHPPSFSFKVSRGCPVGSESSIQIKMTPNFAQNSSGYPLVSQWARWRKLLSSKESGNPCSGAKLNT